MKDMFLKKNFFKNILKPCPLKSISTNPPFYVTKPVLLNSGVLKGKRSPMSDYVFPILYYT